MDWATNADITDPGTPLVLTRVVDAPRDRVWNAWTNEDSLARWWGPKAFELHTCRLDLRPGGTFLYGMTSAVAGDMWGKFTFREIVEPERLVWVVAFSDPTGATTRNPWDPNWPLETLSVVTFDEADGGTRITVEWLVVDDDPVAARAFDASRASMEQGWAGTFDSLQAFLNGSEA